MRFAMMRFEMMDSALICADASVNVPNVHINHPHL